MTATPPPVALSPSAPDPLRWWTDEDVEVVAAWLPRSVDPVPGVTQGRARFVLAALSPRVAALVADAERAGAVKALRDLELGVYENVTAERDEARAALDRVRAVTEKDLTDFVWDIRWHEQGMWRIVNDEGYTTGPVTREVAERDAAGWPHRPDLPYRAEPWPRPTLADLFALATPAPADAEACDAEFDHDHGTTAQNTMTAPTDPRLPACVAAWPDCEEGAYNPACCRFPKSCSCTIRHDGGPR